MARFRFFCQTWSAGLLVVVCSMGCFIAPTGSISATATENNLGTLEFVESCPAGTVLGLPDLADAPDIWPRIFEQATSKIQVASFYYSRQGDGKDAAAPAGTPDRLLPALNALADAAGRNVDVQILADKKFLNNYSEVTNWLGSLDNVEARILDADNLWDGVLHAKYFLVDDNTLYVGSQNWDWRAMDQIHELGVLVKHPALARELESIYKMDWQLAAETYDDKVNQDYSHQAPVQPALNDIAGVPLLTAAGDTVSAVLAASPARALPKNVLWDLPLMVEMIDSASDSLHIQLLSYGLTDREHRLFDDLDRAIRRASARGVDVRIILANWSKTRYKIPWIKSLTTLSGVEIRFSNIPEYERGFIPFARVEHAKYLTVDGQACWIGTSNWSRGYFYNSRNVSLFFRGNGATRDPDRFFNQSWHSPYMEIVMPDGEYTPPKRN